MNQSSDFNSNEVYNTKVGLINNNKTKLSKFSTIQP